MECVYLGYLESKKAYRVYHHQSKCFLESCNVIFDEGTGTTEHVEIEIGPSVEGGKDNVLENSQKTKFEQSAQTPNLPAPTSMPAAPSLLLTPVPTTHLRPDEGTVPCCWRDNPIQCINLS